MLLAFFSLSVALFMGFWAGRTLTQDTADFWKRQYLHEVRTTDILKKQLHEAKQARHTHGYRVPSYLSEPKPRVPGYKSV